jgi:signal transduction histidine kinase
VQALARPVETNHVTVVVGPLPDVQVPANLYQVLVNLIKNAVDAQAQGGAVRIDAQVEGAYLDLEVADTGPGIPEDDLAHIFEPFFTRKEIGMGTGLGLAVCKELIARMGGVILARNQPDCGCAFSIRLPLGGR